MRLPRVPWAAAAVCLVPLSFPVEQLGPTLGPVRPIYLATVASVALVAIGRLRRREPVVVRSAVLAAIGAVVLSAVVSTIVGVNPVGSLRLDVDYLLGLGLAAAAAACPDGRSVRLVLGGTCLVGGGICVQGVLTAASLKPHYGGALVENRATGIFGQPNELGSFAAFVVILSIALFFAVGRRHPLRIPLAVAIVAGLAAVAISLSRGSWVGLVLGLVVLLILAPSVRRPIVATVAAVAATVTVLIVALPNQSLLTILADRAASVVDGQRNPYDFRLQIWAEAAQLIEAHPWLGTGPGSYHFLASRTPSPVAWVAPEHAHSLILTMTTEQGVIGMAALSLAVWIVVRSIARRWRQPAIDRDRVTLAGVCAALAIVLGQGLLDYPLRNAVLASIVWLLLGLLAALLAAGTERQFVHNGVRSAGPPTGGTPMKSSSPAHSRRWHPPVIIAAIVAAIFLGAVLAVVQAWPTGYAATSVVSLTPKVTAMTPFDTMQLVGQKYAVVATSESVMQAAGMELNIDPDQLSSNTTAALAAGSGNLEITVEWPDRNLAVAAANALAKLVVAQATPDALVDAEATSLAQASRTDTTPARPLLRTIGVVAALLLGAATWTVLTGRTRRRPFDHSGSRRPEDGPPRARTPLADSDVTAG